MPSNEVQHCRKVHGISIVFVIVHFDELEDCVVTRGLAARAASHLTHNTFTNTVIGVVPAGRKPGWLGAVGGVGGPQLVDRIDALWLSSN